MQIVYSGNDAVQQTQQILSFIQDPAERPDAILVGTRRHGHGPDCQGGG